MQQINPILRMDYPDPDVIRVGDVYYMVSTTMHFFPGGVILPGASFSQRYAGKRAGHSVDVL